METLYLCIELSHIDSNKFTPKGLSFIKGIPDTSEILCEDEVFGPVDWGEDGGVYLDDEDGSEE